jgi:hypothetical protein
LAASAAPRQFVGFTPRGFLSPETAGQRLQESSPPAVHIPGIQKQDT